MTTYRVVSQHFVAALVVENDLVIQAAPVLQFAVCKTFISVRDYCTARGWQIEPLADDYRPSRIDIKGVSYELIWNGNVLTRIMRHIGDEVTECTYADLPDQLKGIL